MKFDASCLRHASGSADVFPWRARDVTFLLITTTGRVSQAQGIAEKRALLETADENDCLLAAWPGRWKQDIFVIDDRKAALAGLAPPSAQVKA
jgi:hypothetical protein